MTPREQQRRARIFVRILEAKHALEALEQLLALPEDKQCAADLVAQVKSFKAELQSRLKGVA
jgi:hypothetical protein